MTTQEQIKQLKAEIETAKIERAARVKTAAAEAKEKELSETEESRQVEGLSLSRYLDDQKEAYVPTLSGN